MEVTVNRGSTVSENTFRSNTTYDLKKLSKLDIITLTLYIDLDSTIKNKEKLYKSLFRQL